MIDALEDLLTDMFVELPNCPRALCLQHLRLASKRFCTETEAYIIKLNPIDVVEDQVKYNLNVGMNGSIARLIEVKIGEDITDDNDVTTPMNPCDYWLEDEFYLILRSAPSSDVTDGLVVKIAFRPDFDDEACFQPWFLERWSQTILAGAKGRLMRMARKSWTDREMSGVYEEEFLDGMGQARAERFRGYKFQDVMTYGRSFDLL